MSDPQRETTGLQVETPRENGELAGSESLNEIVGKEKEDPSLSGGDTDSAPPSASSSPINNRAVGQNKGAATTPGKVPRSPGFLEKVGGGVLNFVGFGGGKRAAAAAESKRQADEEAHKTADTPTQASAAAAAPPPQQTQADEQEAPKSVDTPTQAGEAPLHKQSDGVGPKPEEPDEEFSDSSDETESEPDPDASEVPSKSLDSERKQGNEDIPQSALDRTHEPDPDASEEAPKSLHEPDPDASEAASKSLDSEGKEGYKDIPQSAAREEPRADILSKEEDSTSPADATEQLTPTVADKAEEPKKAAPEETPAAAPSPAAAEDEEHPYHSRSYFGVVLKHVGLGGNSSSGRKPQQEEKSTAAPPPPAAPKDSDQAEKFPEEAPLPPSSTEGQEITPSDGASQGNGIDQAQAPQNETSTAPPSSPGVFGKVGGGLMSMVGLGGAAKAAENESREAPESGDKAGVDNTSDNATDPTPPVEEREGPASEEPREFPKSGEQAGLDNSSKNATDPSPEAEENEIPVSEEPREFPASEAEETQQEKDTPATDKAVAKTPAEEPREMPAIAAEEPVQEEQDLKPSTGGYGAPSDDASREKGEDQTEAEEAPKADETFPQESSSPGIMGRFGGGVLSMVGLGGAAKAVEDRSTRERETPQSEPSKEQAGTGDSLKDSTDRSPELQEKESSNTPSEEDQREMPEVTQQGKELPTTHESALKTPEEELPREFPGSPAEEPVEEQLKPPSSSAEEPTSRDVAPADEPSQEKEVEENGMEEAPKSETNTPPESSPGMFGRFGGGVMSLVGLGGVAKAAEDRSKRERDTPESEPSEEQAGAGDSLKDSADPSPELLHKESSNPSKEDPREMPVSSAGETQQEKEMPTTDESAGKTPEEELPREIPGSPVEEPVEEPLKPPSSSAEEPTSRDAAPVDEPSQEKEVGENGTEEAPKNETNTPPESSPGVFGRFGGGVMSMVGLGGAAKAAEDRSTREKESPESEPSEEQPGVGDSLKDSTDPSPGLQGKESSIPSEEDPREMPVSSAEEAPQEKEMPATNKWAAKTPEEKLPREFPGSPAEEPVEEPLKPPSSSAEELTSRDAAPGDEPIQEKEVGENGTEEAPKNETNTPPESSPGVFGRFGGGVMSMVGLGGAAKAAEDRSTREKETPESEPSEEQPGVGDSLKDSTDPSPELQGKESSIPSEEDPREMPVSSAEETPQENEMPTTDELAAKPPEEELPREIPGSPAEDPVEEQLKPPSSSAEEPTSRDAAPIDEASQQKEVGENGTDEAPKNATNTPQESSPGVFGRFGGGVLSMVGLGGAAKAAEDLSTRETPKSEPSEEQAGVGDSLKDSTDSSPELQEKESSRTPSKEEQREMPVSLAEEAQQEKEMPREFPGSPAEEPVEEQLKPQSSSDEEPTSRDAAPGDESSQEKELGETGTEESPKNETNTPPESSPGVLEKVGGGVLSMVGLGGAAKAAKDWSTRERETPESEPSKEQAGAGDSLEDSTDPSPELQEKESSIPSEEDPREMPVSEPSLEKERGGNGVEEAPKNETSTPQESSPGILGKVGGGVLSMVGLGGAAKAAEDYSRKGPESGEEQEAISDSSDESEDLSPEEEAQAKGIPAESQEPREFPAETQQENRTPTVPESEAETTPRELLHETPAIAAAEEQPGEEEQQPKPSSSADEDTIRDFLALGGHDASQEREAEPNELEEAPKDETAPSGGSRPGMLGKVGGAVLPMVGLGGAKLAETTPADSPSKDVTDPTPEVVQERESTPSEDPKEFPLSSEERPQDLPREAPESEVQAGVGNPLESATDPTPEAEQNEVEKGPKDEASPSEGSSPGMLEKVGGAVLPVVGLGGAKLAENAPADSSSKDVTDQTPEAAQEKESTPSQDPKEYPLTSEDRPQNLEREAPESEEEAGVGNPLEKATDPTPEAEQREVEEGPKDETSPSEGSSPGMLEKAGGAVLPMVGLGGAKLAENAPPDSASKDTADPTPEEVQEKESPSKDPEEFPVSSQERPQNLEREAPESAEQEGVGSPLENATDPTPELEEKETPVSEEPREFPVSSAEETDQEKGAPATEESLPKTPEEQPREIPAIAAEVPVQEQQQDLGPSSSTPVEGTTGGYEAPNDDTSQEKGVDRAEPEEAPKAAETPPQQSRSPGFMGRFGGGLLSMVGLGGAAKLAQNRAADHSPRGTTDPTQEDQEHGSAAAPEGPKELPVSPLEEAEDKTQQEKELPMTEESLGKTPPEQPREIPAIAAEDPVDEEQRQLGPSSSTEEEPTSGDAPPSDEASLEKEAPKDESTAGEGKTGLLEKVGGGVLTMAGLEGIKSAGEEPKETPVQEEKDFRPPSRATSGNLAPTEAEEAPKDESTPGTLEKVGGGVLSMAGLGGEQPKKEVVPTEAEEAPRDETTPRDSSSGTLEKVGGGVLSMAGLGGEQPKETPAITPEEPVQEDREFSPPSRAASGNPAPVEPSQEKEVVPTEAEEAPRDETTPRDSSPGTLEKVGGGVLSMAGLAGEQPKQSPAITPEEPVQEEREFETNPRDSSPGTLEKVGGGVLSMASLGGEQPKETPAITPEEPVQDERDSSPGALKKVGGGVLSMAGLGGEQPKETPAITPEEPVQDERDSSPGALKKVGGGVLSMAGLGGEQPKETPATTPEEPVQDERDSSPGALEKVGGGVLSMAGLGGEQPKPSPATTPEEPVQEERDSSPGTLEKVGGGVLSMAGLGGPKSAEEQPQETPEIIPDEPVQEEAPREETTPRESDRGTLEKVGGVLSMVGLGGILKAAGDKPKESPAATPEEPVQQERDFKPPSRAASVDPAPIEPSQEKDMVPTEGEEAPRDDTTPRESTPGTLEKVGGGVLSMVGLGGVSKPAEQQPNETPEITPEEPFEKDREFRPPSRAASVDPAPIEASQGKEVVPTEAEEGPRDETTPRESNPGTLEKVGGGVLSMAGLEAPKSAEEQTQKTPEILPDEPVQEPRDETTPRESNQGTLEKVGGGVLSMVGLGGILKAAGDKPKETPATTPDEPAQEERDFRPSGRDLAPSELEEAPQDETTPQESNPGTLEKVGGGVLSMAGLAGAPKPSEKQPQETPEILPVEPVQEEAPRDETTPRESNQGTLEKVGGGVLSMVGLGGAKAAEERPKEPPAIAPDEPAQESNPGTLEKVGGSVLSTVGLEGAPKPSDKQPQETPEILPVEPVQEEAPRDETTPRESNQGTLEKVGGGVLSMVGLGGVKAAEERPKETPTITPDEPAQESSPGMLEKVGGGVLSTVGLGGAPKPSEEQPKETPAIAEDPVEKPFDAPEDTSPAKDGIPTSAIASQSPDHLSEETAPLAKEGAVEQTPAEEAGLAFDRQPSLSVNIPKPGEVAAAEEISTPTPRTIARGLEPTTPLGTPLRQRVEQLEQKLAQLEGRQESPVSEVGSTTGHSTPRSSFDTVRSLRHSAMRHVLEEIGSKGTLLERVASLEQKLAFLTSHQPSPSQDQFSPPIPPVAEEVGTDGDSQPAPAPARGWSAAPAEMNPEETSKATEGPVVHVMPSVMPSVAGKAQGQSPVRAPTPLSDVPQEKKSKSKFAVAKITGCFTGCFHHSRTKA